MILKMFAQHGIGMYKRVISDSPRFADQPNNRYTSTISR